MSKIDWSKAPEGATHWFSPFFYRVDAHDVVAMHETTWLRSSYTKSELLGRDGCIARQVTWTGAGLPPVGTVCEIQHESLGWTRCEIVDHKVMDSTGVTMAIAWIDANTLDQSQGIRFRPIRTQAQIEAEEREKAIAEMSEVIKTQFSFSWVFEKLYDAGYRKQGEAK